MLHYYEKNNLYGPHFKDYIHFLGQSIQNGPGHVAKMCIACLSNSESADQQHKHSM